MLMAHASVLLLMLCVLCASCASARTLHISQLFQALDDAANAVGSSQAADCGAPGAICGSSIINGTKCPQGSGWCQQGYYCGVVPMPRPNLTAPAPDKPPELRCLRVPPDCGQEGKPCCPSNALTPHTQPSDVLGRMPFCKGQGLVCFAPSQHSMQDFYQGNEGSRPCTYVAPDCGSAAGKPCCPLLWRTVSNPDVGKGRDSDCWAPGLYCEYAVKREGRNVVFGTCVANQPNCGTLGNECCVRTTDFGPIFTCQGLNGAKGYCAPPGVDAASQKRQGGPGKPPALSVCTPCPDAETVAAHEGQYPGCVERRSPPPAPRGPQKVPQMSGAHPVPVSMPARG